MDHDDAISLYADDPNGIMVEFSTWVRSMFTEDNRRRAEELIHAAAPAVNTAEPPMELFEPGATSELTSEIIENARRNRPNRRGA